MLRQRMTSAACSAEAGGPHFIIGITCRSFLLARRRGEVGLRCVLHHQQTIRSGSATIERRGDGFHLGVAEIGAAGVQVLAFFFTDEYVDLRRVFPSFAGNIIHGVVSPPAAPGSGGKGLIGYTRVSSCLLLRSMVKSSFFLYRKMPLPATKSRCSCNELSSDMMTRSVCFCTW